MSRSNTNPPDTPSWMYRSEAFAEDLPGVVAVVPVPRAPTPPRDGMRRALRAFARRLAGAGTPMAAAWPVAARWS